MEKNKWKTLSQEIVHENPWYKVRHDKVTHPDGTPGNYFVLDRPHCVFVIPVQEGKIHMVRQYRYAVQQDCLEVPAGSLHAGESPLEAAKRELLEETGLEGTQWEEAGCFAMNNGLSNELAYVFLVTELTQAEIQVDQDVSEFITTEQLPIDNVYRLITDGELFDGASVTALAFVSKKIKAYV